MPKSNQVIVNVEVKGWIEIGIEEAHVLDYMTNIDVKHYGSLLGSKYQPHEYEPILLKIRECVTKMLYKDKQVREAINKS